MKHVVSVSLGTSKRDKSFETTILGETFKLERRGTDGDKKRFHELMLELDDQVDAFGVGGADIYVATAKKKYAFKDVLKLIEGVKSPVVDGSGLKHTLERTTIQRLQSEGTVDFKNERVLLVSAVDRFGMAQALDEACPNVVYGDLIFGLGIPIPVRQYYSVDRLARLLLPIVTACPIDWFYPTGKKQEERAPKAKETFDEATFVCGDWHYIRRYMPDDMSGKTILTQTVRDADLELLKKANVKRLITTTPEMGGETFATNVLEALIVAHLGKRPEELSDQDYLDVLNKLGWSPHVTDFQAAPVDSPSSTAEDKE